MGVIKKIECPLNIKYASSEETLYIPSSDDEQSVVEEERTRVNNNKPRLLRHNIPTVGSASPSLKINSGKKKSRRYNNVNQLITLAEEDEDQEVTINDFVGSSKTPFSVLLEDENSLEKWDKFICSSEEKQQELINEGREKKCNIQKQSNFPEISPGLKRLLKKKNFPTGMLQFLEQELVNFFLAMPTKTYISPELSSFQRLLLHTLSDYHHLISCSQMESRNVSTHLRPHVLPPLGVRGNLNSGQANQLHANSEKGVKQRIGTPAPNKKRPIPDDLDLNILNLSRGNPSIKVDSCKLDETRNDWRNFSSSEKQLKGVPEGNLGPKDSNLNFRLKKKPQLDPIVSMSDSRKIHGDVNGNGVNSDFTRRGLEHEKIHLPNKYAPLKPISKKNVNFGGNVDDS